MSLISNTCKLSVNFSRAFSSSALRSSENHYDVIVAGGGMVGTTLACTLGKNPMLSNHRILLLESEKKREWKLPENHANRVSALSPGTYQLLDNIGAWQHIANARFGTIKRMQVWDALSRAMISFNDDNPEEDVAYVVENDVTLSAVEKELENLDKVEVLHQAKIKTCFPASGAGPVQIAMEDGTSYSCNLLLGCDGANSQVRKSCKIHYLSWNYNQFGVVATLDIDQPSENTTAWQRYLPNSEVVALLPLDNNISSCVWCMSIPRAKEMLALPQERFIEVFNETLHKPFPINALIDQATNAFDGFAKCMKLPSNSMQQLPPKITGCQEGSRAAFPLGFGHASNYITNGVALVGDAAHRIHPSAGQGVNLGFGDIVCLNKVLGNTVSLGGKIGSVGSLKMYETERQRHNIPTMLTVDLLSRLYGTELMPVVLLRSMGLQTTHALTPVKKFIMSQAAA